MNPRERDRRALKPAPYRRFFSDGHVRSELWAKTLDELREYFGEYGDGAAHDAQLSAVSVWLMRQDKAPPGALDAIRLYRSHALAVTNHIRHDLHPWRSLLADLPRKHREAIERFALDIIRDWEAAGSPGLASSMRTTQQSVLRCIQNQRNQRDRQAASEALEPYQQQIERIVSHGT